MKLFRLVFAAALALGMAAPIQAQMSSMTQMGGGTYSTNLVSPTTADTQIGRGMLMISQAMPGMRGMPMGGSGRGLRIRLILTGVINSGGLVTSSGNHLYVSGSLISADGSSQPISVDQLFDIINGNAVLYVPLTLSTFTLPATLEVNSVELTEADPSKTFGVTGLRMSAGRSPQGTMTPGMGGATMTPHMGGSTMTPGMGAQATMTPGMGGATMTPHMGGSTMTPGMGPQATMTPRMGM